MQNHTGIRGIVVVSFALALSWGGNARAAGQCWAGDPSKVTLEWTAYKFTEKKGVKAKFTKVAIKGPTKGKSVLNILKASTFKVDASSIDTGDKGRDTNIYTAFLQKLAGDIHGGFNVSGGKGKDVAKVELRLNFNGKSQVIPLQYALSGDGNLELTGAMDVLKFGADAAMESLKAACKTQHTGSDGKSVTWSTVDFRISAAFTKTDC
ncbi:MAG TPA: YceI family protein [Bdellovibrionota bacterium]|nr:YceI family protein [Bdellovibrionota bacterium]